MTSYQTTDCRWQQIKRSNKGAFSLHQMSGPLRTGHSLLLIWSVGRMIPDYFETNQWCRTCVSRNDNDSLPITSKEIQLAILFFHYRLPLCPVQLCAGSWVNIVAKSNKFPLPIILVWDWKWVNTARYSVEEHLIGWWVGRRTHFVSGRQTVGRPRDHPRLIRRGLFTPFMGGSDACLERPVRGGLDIRWSEKAP